MGEGVPGSAPAGLVPIPPGAPLPLAVAAPPPPPPTGAMAEEPDPLFPIPIPIPALGEEAELFLAPPLPEEGISMPAPSQFENVLITASCGPGWGLQPGKVLPPVTGSCTCAV